MANRIVLNTISYHGAGAIKEIPGEITRRGFQKVFVCTDPDLVKFGVAAKVTDLLDEAGIAWSLYSEIKPNPTIQNVKDGVELVGHLSGNAKLDQIGVGADEDLLVAATLELAGDLLDGAGTMIRDGIENETISH